MTKEEKNEINLEVKFLPEKLNPSPIKFNYEEIKEKLALVMEKYKNIAFTEETVKDAKALRAYLNKVKTAFDNERKRVKGLYLAPVDEMEKQFKELTTLIDEPVNEIAAQIYCFETKQKQEKRTKIEEFYKENVGELSNILNIEKIFQTSWLNSTTTLASIKKEIKAKFQKVQDELQIISNLNSDFEIELRQTYIETLDLSAVMMKEQKLAAAKKENEERIEAARIKKEQKELAAKTIKEESIVDTSTPLDNIFNPVAPEVEEPAIMTEPTVVEEPLVKIKTFSLVLTKEKYFKFYTFLEENNIEFEEITE